MSTLLRTRLAASLCTLTLLASACGDDDSVTPGDNTGGDGDYTGGDGDNTGGDGDNTGGDGDGMLPVGDSIEGEYWMRTDISARLMQSGASILSDITAYSLVKITKDGSQYKMVDWQCHVTTAQTCESICTAASSTTTEGQAYVPSQRTLTINGSSWSTSACAAAVGWKWDCAKDAPTPVPTSANDPLVYNPGGGLPGVDINASVTVLGALMCTTGVAQKVDVVYSGNVTNGALQTSGVATDNGSQQNALDQGCGTVPNPVPTGPGTLRFAKRDVPGGDDPATWTCPSLAEFQSALPQR